MAQFQVWKLDDYIDKYDSYVKKCSIVSPYHLTEYLLAEEKAEDSETKIFVYEDGEHLALCPQIIRRISAFPNLYDMIAPHEYSGIISDSTEPLYKEELLKNMEIYCKENNIIFQFTRINPYMRDLPGIYTKNGYDVIYSNFQIYVDLTQTKEQIIADYKPNVRYGIRRAEREHLKFEIAEKSSENIDLFKAMYQKAMDILEARKFLYFNDAYFKSLIACECAKLVFVRDETGQVIASGIIILDNSVAYYHLSCFDRNYKLKRPMNYLLHSMIMWSKENGCEIFHLGGGGESLRQFKEEYSSSKIDYYIADKVCDVEQYDRVCNAWKNKFPQFANETYYPLYRYSEGLKSETNVRKWGGATAHRTVA